MSHIKPFSLLCVLCVLCASLFFSGCDLSSQQRAAQLNTYVLAGQQLSVNLDGQVAAAQAVLTQAEAILADPNIPLSQSQIAEIVAGVKKAQTELTSAVQKKVQVDAAIASCQKALAELAANPDADISDELAAYGLMLSEAQLALPPPWNLYVGLGGLIVGFIGRALATRKADAEKKAKIEELAPKAEALPPVIKSTEKLLNLLPSESEVEAGAAVGMTREQAVKILKEAQGSAAVSAVVDSLTKAPIEKM